MDGGSVDAVLPADEPDAEQSLEVLGALAELGAGRLPPQLVEAMGEVRTRAQERLACSQAHIVIAVAGGTGSGKSSLINAVLGQTISAPGVRRPTTDQALAAVVGERSGADPLLDWLRVYERHSVPAEGHLSALEGAVVLDLPDIDSVIREHEQVAERLLERCDLLLWVLDPLKYAHAVAHEGYLRRLAHHAEVLLVALNHTDRLAQADQEACLSHLHELLAQDGLETLEVLTTSAATEAGVTELATRLACQVQERRAPVARLRADAAALIARGREQLPEAETMGWDEATLAESQRAAVNATALRQGGEAAYHRLGRAALRSPVARWLRRLWPGGQRRAPEDGYEHEGAADAPAPSVVEPPARRGLLDAVEPAAARLPVPAADRLRELAAAAAAPLASDLRQRLEALDYRPVPRLWWRLVAAARGMGELAALAGAAWLLLRSAVEWLALPPLPAPALVGEIPWPLALLAGGALVSPLLGIAARPALRLGARRHGRGVQRRIEREAQDTQRPALRPLREELEACRRLCDCAHRASSSGDP